MFMTDFLPEGLGLQNWLENSKTWAVGNSQKLVISEWGSMKLLKYPSPENRVHSTPILVIPSLINRHYVLDLLPGRSLLEYFYQKGHQVYVIDWGIPSSEERFLTLESLLQDRISEFVELVLKEDSSPQLHLAGHCLGGTLAAVWTAANDLQVKTLTLMTTPVNFKHTGVLGTWATHPRFNLQAFQEAYDHAPWYMLQAAFNALKPMAFKHKIQKVFSKKN